MRLASHEEEDAAVDAADSQDEDEEEFAEEMQEVVEEDDKPPWWAESLMRDMKTMMGAFTTMQNDIKHMVRHSEAGKGQPSNQYMVLHTHPNADLSERRACWTTFSIPWFFIQFALHVEIIVGVCAPLLKAFPPK